jgi:hypothetical protein
MFIHKLFRVIKHKNNLHIDSFKYHARMRPQRYEKYFHYKKKTEKKLHIAEFVLPKYHACHNFVS